MSDLSIRPARQDESDVKAIFALLTGMFEEQTMFALDGNKALAEIYRICGEEAAWVVFDGDKLVASCGLVEAGFWYSEEPSLVSRWLFVAPDYRPDGKCWEMILTEIKTLSTAIGFAALIDIFNPARSRTPKHVSLVASRMGFYPKGAWLRVDPAADKEPV